MKKIFLILIIMLLFGCGNASFMSNQMEIISVGFSKRNPGSCIYTIINGEYSGYNKLFDDEYIIYDKCDKFKIGDKVYLEKVKDERLSPPK